ncbi:hypothetical protein AB6A40_008697 [Gnathostoma spinigerum]|uniref:MARVEL domain-containing protein n=1 Tax=Gnathostoma spinigerum TaxID=75299 RepID=A0ABD6EY37_9BILA
MSAVRHETYTSTEPDGTLVTTTTRTQTKYGYERVYGCGPGPLNEAYCCSPMGLLRIAEIIIGLVIVSLITAVYGPGPFKGILFGQTFLLIFAAVALCLTFMYLVVFFFELHRTHLEFWPWRTTVKHFTIQ